MLVLAFLTAQGGGPTLHRFSVGGRQRWRRAHTPPHFRWWLSTLFRWRRTHTPPHFCWWLSTLFRWRRIHTTLKLRSLVVVGWGGGGCVSCGCSLCVCFCVPPRPCLIHISSFSCFFSMLVLAYLTAQGGGPTPHPHTPNLSLVVIGFRKGGGAVGPFLLTFYYSTLPSAVCSVPWIVRGPVPPSNIFGRTYQSFTQGNTLAPPTLF